MKHDPSKNEQWAIEQAAKWHGDQKYGSRPYMDHLKEVRDALLEFGYDDDDLLCAAWLHDAIEDTDMPMKLIAERLGSDIVRLVWAVTGFGENRKERAEFAYRNIQNYPRAAILKAADRIANTRASIGTPKEQMYAKAWPGFHSNIGVLIPKEMLGELLALTKV